MCRKTASGFTLIEALTALAVLAILMAVGVPMFMGVIRNNRITTQANEFVGALNFARSEAIKRNGSVLFCRVASETATDCENEADVWEHWIIRTGADNVVRRGFVDTYGGKIVVRSTLTDEQVVFGADGLARSGGALVNDLELSVCGTNARQNNMRRVILGAASRMSTVIDSGDCES